MNEIPATDRSVTSHPQAPGRAADSSHDFGRYRIERRVGDGRSSLFLAKDETLGRTVALKVAPAPMSGGEPDFTRYMRGARAAAALRSAGVAEVFDTGEVDGRSFIAREWIDGAPLNALLRREALTLVQRVRQIEMIAGVVGDVHRAGVLHGNLTSSNIIFNRNREPVLIDFVDGGTVADDIQRLGQLLQTVVTQHANAGEAIDWSLEKICDRARTGPDQYRSADLLRADLATWIQQRQRTAIPDGRRTRGALMAAGGYLLLLISLHYVLIYALGAYWSYSSSAYGVVLQSLLQQAGPPFLIGAYLFIAGLRGLGLLPSEHTAVRDASRSAAEPGSPPAGDAAPFPPSGSPLSVERSEGAWCVSRPLGAWPGALFALLCVAIFFIGLVWSALHAVPGGLPIAGIGVGLLFLETCVCVFLIRWLWIRPVYVNPCSTEGSTMLQRVVARLASWIGTERLAIGGGDCRHAVGAGPLLVCRTVPLSDLWDVAPGDAETGVEIATSRSPVRVARRMAERDRLWLAAASAREIARARDPQSTPGDVARVRPADPRLSRSFVIWGLCLFAWVVGPIIVLIEAGANLFGPFIYPPGSSLRALQIAIDLMGLMGTVAATGLMAAGARRLWRLQESGVRLFQAGFWLQFGVFVALFGVVLGLSFAAAIPYVPIAPAINLNCLATSVRFILSVMCVLTLSISRPRLPLQAD